MDPEVANGEGPPGSCKAEYLLRLAQVHESFRKAELEALAALAGVDVEFTSHSEKSPFWSVRLPSDAAARALVSRSILAQGIYELWGGGSDYAALHADVHRRTSHRWPSYKLSSFRFTVDAYQGKRSTSAQRTLIESFSYLGFEGPIQMRGADLELCIFEEYEHHAPQPHTLYLARFVGASSRNAKAMYDLKKRHYISTTSMDAELALVTANMAHAAPGKILYDPFMGTGSFPIACAHFGAVVVGSDIDGRSIRGAKGRSVLSNFKQYGLTSRYLDAFVSDLTNTPCAIRRWLDGIVCDPPYGVREGLKVLGHRSKELSGAVHRIDGVEAHKQEGYIPPKRPYSFEAMLDDVLDFAADTLVENGRLSMWMPTANDEDIELPIPSHPCMEVVNVCIQPFNRWSRRLLTYRRLPLSTPNSRPFLRQKSSHAAGLNADDLNSFRKKYFSGFKSPEADAESPPDKEAEAAAGAVPLRSGGSSGNGAEIC